MKASELKTGDERGIMPKIYGVFYRGKNEDVRMWNLASRGIWPTLELAKAHLAVESYGSILEHAIFEMQRVEVPCDNCVNEARLKSEAQNG